MEQEQFPITLGEQYQFYLGVDWGTQTHALCLIPAAQPARPQRHSVKHNPQCLAQMLAWIEQHIDGHWPRLAVAIERPHGLLVQLLLGRQAAVFAINPKQLDSFRTRYNVAGAKDDRLDALVLADTLPKDSYAYHRVTIKPADEMMLRELTHTQEDVAQDWRRLCNRLWEMLVRYYPTLLALAGGADEPWLWELLEAAPTPRQGAALPLKKLAALLRRQRLRRFSAERLHEVLAQGALLELDPAFIAAQAERTLCLLRCIRPLFEELRRLEARVAAALAAIQQAEAAARAPVAAPPPLAAAELVQVAACNTSPVVTVKTMTDDTIQTMTDDTIQTMTDAKDRIVTESAAPAPTDFEIIDSLAGFGPGTLATIYSEAIEPLRQGNYHRIRAVCGAAPITERSGKTCAIHMRYACNGRLRQALHYAANSAYQHVPCWGERYQTMRKSGQTHGRALRGIADRMLRVLVSMLRHRTLFDPERLGRIPTGQLNA